jgi:SAM-dependent methyltransferase
MRGDRGPGGADNGMTHPHADDWDQHWAQLGAAAEVGPTPKYRRRIILAMLAAGPPARLLEIGSGTGEFAEDFCGRYPSSGYLGLELSRTGVEFSSRRVLGARFVQRDLLQPTDFAEGLDFAATHAICSEVLEHVDAPSALLANATRYMAPGCKLIVTVPGGPMSAFYRHIGHRRHYASCEIAPIIESAGFHVEKSYEAGFPFFNLFRLFITWRGEKLLSSISGPPSAIVRFGMWLFDMLFRLNLMRWGWQTVVVACYGGRAD